MNELAIFVDSYDGNHDLWDNFFTIMDHYWKDCAFKKYLVTNQQDYTAYNTTSLKVGPDTNWVYCTLNGLKQIEEEYILFLLEDYYFSKKINNYDFDRIIDTMKEKDCFFYRLSLINGLDKSKECVQINENFPYAINLQPAIWRRKSFIQYLETMREEGISSPWQFEFYFIRKAENKELLVVDGSFFGVLYDTRDLMGYKNAIIQGKWDRSVVSYFRNNTNLNIAFSQRQLMSLWEMTWDRIKVYGHKIIPYKRREKIKIWLKKLHFRFMR